MALGFVKKRPVQTLRSGERETGFPSTCSAFASVLVTTPGGTNPANGLFSYRKLIELWRKLYFDRFPGTGIAADTADPDSDGLANLVEYAFGLSPIAPGGSLPAPQIVGPNYSVTFLQPGGVGGITYSAEWSPDLAPNSWTPIPDTGTGPTHIFGRMFFRYVITEQ